jgi:AhpD family alkylhydroperoxidase
MTESRDCEEALHKSTRLSPLNPKVLATHFELYKALMFQPSPLSRADREALAVAVSRANSCAYCAAHHGAALTLLREESSLPQEGARMGRAGRACTRDRIGGRHRSFASGWSLQTAILDAVLTVAYFLRQPARPGAWARTRAGIRGYVSPAPERFDLNRSSTAPPRTSTPWCPV